MAVAKSRFGVLCAAGVQAFPTLRKGGSGFFSARNDMVPHICWHEFSACYFWLSTGSEKNGLYWGDHPFCIVSFYPRPARD